MADKKNTKFNEDNYKILNIIKGLSLDDGGMTRYKDRPSAERKISDEITEKERIKNEGLRQDIILKRFTLWILFGFLALETIMVFVFSFFQAIHWPFGFNLEEWSFKLLISATITQITIMLIIAVKHLFPKKD